MWAGGGEGNGVSPAEGRPGHVGEGNKDQNLNQEGNNGAAIVTANLQPRETAPRALRMHPIITKARAAVKHTRILGKSLVRHIAGASAMARSPGQAWLSRLPCLAQEGASVYCHRTTTTCVKGILSTRSTPTYISLVEDQIHLTVRSLTDDATSSLLGDQIPQ